MFQLPIAAITGMGKFSKSLIKFRALATNAPTMFAGILALSLRSAPAQKIPGLVLFIMTTRTPLSNLTASTASINWKTKFLLNEFLASGRFSPKTTIPDRFPSK